MLSLCHARTARIVAEAQRYDLCVAEREAVMITDRPLSMLRAALIARHDLRSCPSALGKQ